MTTQLAIIQDLLTGTLFEIAPRHAETLQAALATGRIAVGGETLDVVSSWPLLDETVLLIHVRGPAGRGPQNTLLRTEADSALLPFLEQLEEVIEARQRSTAEKSYTRSLLDAGTGKIGSKLREEADELALALAEESDDRVTSEAADVVFHLLVGLRLRGLQWGSVIEVLRRRFGVSGHAEKASRSVPAPAP